MKFVLMILALVAFFGSSMVSTATIIPVRPDSLPDTAHLLNITINSIEIMTQDAQTSPLLPSDAHTLSDRSGDSLKCCPVAGQPWLQANWLQVTNAISDLRARGGNTILQKGRGTCMRLQCSYQAAIWLCNDQLNILILANSVVADYAQNIKDGCRKVGWWGTVSACGQQFDTDSWNVFISYDMDDCKDFEMRHLQISASPDSVVESIPEDDPIVVTTSEAVPVVVASTPAKAPAPVATTLIQEAGVSIATGLVEVSYANSSLLSKRAEMGDFYCCPVEGHSWSIAGYANMQTVIDKLRIVTGSVTITKGPRYCHIVACYFRSTIYLCNDLDTDNTVAVSDIADFSQWIADECKHPFWGLQVTCGHLFSKTGGWNIYMAYHDTCTR